MRGEGLGARRGTLWVAMVIGFLRDAFDQSSDGSAETGEPLRQAQWGHLSDLPGLPIEPSVFSPSHHLTGSAVSIRFLGSFKSSVDDVRAFGDHSRGLHGRAGSSVVDAKFRCRSRCFAA